MKSSLLALTILLFSSLEPRAQEPPQAPGRFEIRTEVFFYDTDILRDAYSREPYRTTLLVDTATGRTWILLKVGDNRVVWSSVDFASPAGPTPGLKPGQ